MNTNERIEEYRREAVEAVETNDFVSSISIEAWPEEVGFGFLDDRYDEDGDSIVARAIADFPTHGVGLVRTVFAKGTDPSFAARVLRKFADMLDGPNGRVIAALGLSDHDVDTAQRFPHGEVIAFNLRDECERRRTQPDGDASSPRDEEEDDL